MSNLNLDGKKRKPNKYMEKPIRITPLSEYEKRVEEERAKRKIVENLTAWQKVWNKRNEKGGA